MLRPSLSVLALFALSGTALDTQYAPGGERKILTEFSLDMETTEMSIERDGEPVDTQGRMGGGAMAQKRRALVVDEVLASADGEPTKLKRSFEELEQTVVLGFGDQERTIESDTPLEGLTLELSVGDDGAIETKIVEGEDPGEAELLEGHVPTLQLDALLPDGEVEAGVAWELDGDQIRRALGVDLQSKLYVRPEPSEGGGGGGGGRGGRSGRSAQLLELAAWEGKATLQAEEVEHEGLRCAVIEIAIEASGELPEPEVRAGGRGGDLWRPFGPNTAESTFEIELEGKLYFSVERHYPVALELEGSARTESNVTRSMGESELVIHTVQAGEVRFTVSVSEPAE